jgi:transposase
MLSPPGALRIFLSVEPADMRRSFDGLAALVEQVLQQDPLSGHVFVFQNRRRDRVKLLYWDRDGYALWYKRIEAGVFRFPMVGRDSNVRSLEIEPTDLAMLLEGIDLSSVRRSPRYRRPGATPPPRRCPERLESALSSSVIG